MGPIQVPQVKVQAVNGCHSCPFCFCFCVGFVEPFKGQPFAKCLYDPASPVRPGKGGPAPDVTITPRQGNQKKVTKVPLRGYWEGETINLGGIEL